MAHIAEGRYDECAEFCLSLIAEPGLDETLEAQSLAMLALSEYYRGDFATAILAGARALAVARRADTPEAWLLAVPAHVLSTAGLPPAPGSVAEGSTDLLERAWSERDRIAAFPVLSRALIGSLVGEAALATGQVDTASDIMAFLGNDIGAATVEAEPIHPMLFFVNLFPVRLAIAQGRISDAFELCERVRELATSAGSRVGIAVSTAVLTTIAGFRGDRPLTRSLAVAVTELFPEPHGQLASNCHFLAAYGLSAVGDIAGAAGLVLRGGQGPDLPYVQTIDRALAYEILVTAAVNAGDLDAARAWAERIMPLGGLPAAEPTVSRTLGRIELALGDAASGADLAAIAEARAILGGNYLEATMAALLQAQSLARAGVNERAADRLTGIAHDAAKLGGYAVTRTAARELRRLGRRLGPVPESGWAGLSERERQVAILVAEGYSNRIIARTLFLSERTVQSHVSRALAALGASSRASLPSKLARPRAETTADALPILTPRQREIVELISEGASNLAIASRLGISVKTVEKHVGEIFLRWGVSSRTGIASLVVAGAARDAG